MVRLFVLVVGVRQLATNYAHENLALCTLNVSKPGRIAFVSQMASSSRLNRMNHYVHWINPSDQPNFVLFPIFELKNLGLPI